MKDNKLLLKILSGTSDANINFNDLVGLLKNLGLKCVLKEVITYLEKKV